MESFVKLIIIFVMSLVVLSGCSTSNVIATGPDTYMVSASGAGFASAGVREAVYKKANGFCSSKGLVMVPISFKAREGKLGSHPPSADLIFRALKPGDPDIGRPMIYDHNQNVNITKSIKISGNENNKNVESDLHSELLKLDDLRKRNLLSDAEFKKEKEKLLQRN
jgi:hypothetical protein